MIRNLIDMPLLRCLFILVWATLLSAACTPAYDGEEVWAFETKKAYMQWVVGDEQRLYLCADDVYCLDRSTGRLLWEFETYGVHSSAPVISDGTLFFQCGGLYALDAETGDVNWEFWTRNWAELSPAVGNGLVFAPMGKRLFCLDADTGKQLWSVASGLLERAPVAVNGSIIFSKGEEIICLDTSSRKVRWRFPVGSDRIKIASAGGLLVSGGFAGLVRAHTIATGEVKWQFDTGVPLVDFCSSPSGKVLVSAGVLYCLSVESGEVSWTFDEENILARECRVLGSRVFVRSRASEIYCLSLHEGAMIHYLQVPSGGRVLACPDGAVFFPGGGSRVVTCLSLQGL